VDKCGGGRDKLWLSMHLLIFTLFSLTAHIAGALVSSRSLPLGLLRPAPRIARVTAGRLSARRLICPRRTATVSWASLGRRLGVSIVPKGRVILQREAEREPDDLSAWWQRCRENARGRCRPVAVARWVPRSGHEEAGRGSAAHGQVPMLRRACAHHLVESTRQPCLDLGKASDGVAVR
jgi:hypothetical protein